MIIADVSVLKPSLVDIGLLLCESMCELYHQQGGEKVEAIAVSQHGIEIMRIPVGNKEFVRSCCAKTTQSDSDLCSKLAELDEWQFAMLLLRECHVPRLNFLARSVAPALLKDSAVVHDRITLATLHDVLSQDHLAEIQLDWDHGKAN